MDDLRQTEVYFRADGAESAQAYEMLVGLTRACKKCGQKQPVFEVEPLSCDVRAKELALCPNCQNENDLIDKDSFRELLLRLSADLGEDIGVANAGVPVCPRTWMIEYRNTKAFGDGSLDINQWVRPIDDLLKTKIESNGKLRPFDWTIRNVPTHHGTARIEAMFLDPYPDTEIEHLMDEWEQNDFRDFNTLVEARSRVRRTLGIAKTKDQNQIALILIALAVVMLVVLGSSLFN